MLISSGSLIPVDALVEVGMNNSSLFIDLVDFEWCYRAKYAGYHVLMTSNVTMKHNVGLTDKKIWRGSILPYVHLLGCIMYSVTAFLLLKCLIFH